MAYAAWHLAGGSAGLVGAALPEFPDFPPPPPALSADAEGELYFASETPFGFDVVLAGMGGARATTGPGSRNNRRRSFGWTQLQGLGP